MRKPLLRIPCGCAMQYPIVCPAARVGERISCPYSGQAMTVPPGSPFGAAEWESLGSHRELAAAVSALGLALPERKARLLACGVARCALNWQRDAALRSAIECGEALADGRPPPKLPAVVRRDLGAGRSVYSPEYRVALRCLEADPRRPALQEANGYEAPEMAVFRDLVPNPFLSFAWNPDWLTTTVRDLAAHAHAAHDFSALPILADALQEAGCDDEQALAHCRGDRLHARGCWVLDAILGKA